AAAALSPPPALVLVADQLSLSPFERSLLLLCAAPDLDPQIAALYRQASPESTSDAPTLALALALFDSPDFDALKSDRPLRTHHLVEIGATAALPLPRCPLRATECALN